MLLRPRRPLPLAPPAPPSPASPEPEPEPRPVGSDPGTPPGGPASPGALVAPVSPGSAQRAPWSARETELLLDTLLQPAVWRSLLLDRRQALPTYRRVSAALARQEVRRTPAQCRRRYKFLKDKLRDGHGQPPGPFDAQIRELMRLLGDHGRRRGRRRSPGLGRPQRGRRPAAAPAPAPAPGEPDASPLPAARDPDADPNWRLRFSPSPPSAGSSRVPGSPPPPALASTAVPAFAPAWGDADPLPGRSREPAPARAPDSPPAPAPSPARGGPDPLSGRPGVRAPPQAAPPALSDSLLEALGHLGDLTALLGPLREQLVTLNQHIEQLRGSFDQTVTLALGFLVGSAVSERGLLAARDPEARP
ncbi:undifferentiated embryonic cell transcription factor 1 [Dasypus novemcinctus]|uniref:undifferentiated embryonic cell transcription factor 1 n=1 Tax=Dasypus novemcinctus TaxID=9361 RepID=UPI00265E2847|nr:undifferentiated embryonic cell transcription factor 1 [Dasypus novemcinctus]